MQRPVFDRGHAPINLYDQIKAWGWLSRAIMEQYAADHASDSSARRRPYGGRFWPDSIPTTRKRNKHFCAFFQCISLSRVVIIGARDTSLAGYFNMEYHQLLTGPTFLERHSAKRPVV